jgi:hypothetical protein
MVVLQVSFVQMFVSAQSPSAVQQAATAVWLQAPVAVLHASVVHGSVSLQSAAAVQQFAFFVNTQVKFGVSHVSVVQMLLSLQSPAASQHPAMRLFWHTLATQTSVVQTLVSAQSASLVQEPAAWWTCPVARSGLSASRLEHAGNTAVASATTNKLRKK